MEVPNVHISTSYSEDEWLQLSGIQHYAFCARQWALIHIEQQWIDNYLTTAGSIEHERVDDYQQSESRGNTLILRSLRVFNPILGISGICDVVEFHSNPHGIHLSKRQGSWIPYPVEYKHGKPKEIDADRLQLCAEAMCLEYMLSCDVPEGSLFYQHTKRREIVTFNTELREQVQQYCKQMHDYFNRGYTPKAKFRPRCKSCSLLDICQPKMLNSTSAKAYIQQTINQ
ncbi:CRISPR-associated protein Cas4 [Galliscardovia ingluviei]|uniref:CRISPR-associated exonuclease Cas4 n=1 Tax=Galliscardovia ingluviei TaxID=1769422 RepID=A0A8J3EY98_9BIFI|nr:CRISPR-associated protein Cas4 [Galliscardovia ingluviei]GGI13096.1 CRISPR-associated protein Cas4 [Galliscardovia ingluviei]